MSLTLLCLEIIRLNLINTLSVLLQRSRSSRSSKSAMRLVLAGAGLLEICEGTTLAMLALT